jgi:hypothetical protein
MDANGDFIIAWFSNQNPGDSGDIYARRHGAAGVAQGDEFRVNTHTPGNQQFPNTWTTQTA